MKRTNKNETTTEMETGRIDFVSVDRVRDTKGGVYFTLTLNGVHINGCRIVEGKNGDFISLPQYKGSDGKWYNHVYFKFSEDDSKQIIAMVEAALNGEEVPPFNR